MNSVKVVKSTDVLPVTLTREEREQAATDLANAIAEGAALEDQKKAAVDQFKAQISRQVANITLYAGLVRNGFELRNVPTERHYCYEIGQVVTYRTDTWKELERRQMTDAERQVTLDEVEEEQESDLQTKRLEPAWSPEEEQAYAVKWTDEDIETYATKVAPELDKTPPTSEDFSEGGVRVFESERHWLDWCGVNCHWCTKGSHNNQGVHLCVLEQDMDGALEGEGTISPDAAKRMGFHERGDNPVWACPEKAAIPEPKRGKGKKG